MTKHIPTLLIALALFVTPIAAGLPDDHLATAFVVALLLAAGALTLAVRPDPDSASGAAAAFESKSVAAYAAFVGVALVSLLWQWLGVHHGAPVYLAPMVRSWAFWLVGLALLIAVPRIAWRREALYAVTAALVLSATIVAGQALANSVMEIAVLHQKNWREFGTSTPDYFAGYLIITIPVTVALFLSARKPLLTAVCLCGALLQLGAMLATASRFAIVSFTVSAITFAVLLLRARAAHPLPPSVADADTLVGTVTSAAPSVRSPQIRSRLWILAALGLVGVLVAARPLIHRLIGPAAADQKHSMDFRVWTWRGSLDLAKAHPLLGTGPGTFVYAYQKYALVGFTRVAHNGYLQVADDTGLLGLAAFLAAFAGIKWAGIRGAGRPTLLAPAAGSDEANRADASGNTQATPNARQRRKGARGRQALAVGPVTDFATVANGGDVAAMVEAVGGRDDTLLLCGATAGLVAGLCQNLIDSDFFITIDGVTILAAAALVAGITSRPLSAPPAASQSESPSRPLAYVAIAATMAVAAVVMVVWGFAALSAKSGEDAIARQDIAEAKSGYETAQTLNPLDAAYPASLGWQVYSRQGRLTDAVYALTRAAWLEPNEQNWRRLAKVYLSSNNPEHAKAAFERGLVNDPNSVELLLGDASARKLLGDDSGVISLYRRVVAIEHSKIATIRAITEFTDTNYTEADIALGDLALKSGQWAEAERHYRDTLATLEAYVIEGGSNNPIKMVESGGVPHPDVDRDMANRYTHAADGLVQALRGEGRPSDANAVSVHEAAILTRFDGVIAESEKELAASHSAQ